MQTFISERKRRKMEINKELFQAELGSLDEILSDDEDFVKVDIADVADSKDEKVAPPKIGDASSSVYAPPQHAKQSDKDAPSVASSKQASKKKPSKKKKGKSAKNKDKPTAYDAQSMEKPADQSQNPDSDSEFSQDLIELDVLMNKLSLMNEVSAKNTFFRLTQMKITFRNASTVKAKSAILNHILRLARTSLAKYEKEDGKYKSKMETLNKKTKRWWKSINSEIVDAISLEPINQLHYPPFELKNDTKTFYFDGKILSHFLISTSNFINPTNREPLSRDICLELDQYLKVNKLGKANVVDAFDLSQILSKEESSHIMTESRRRAELLQNEATNIMSSLFSFQSEQQHRQRRGGGGPQRSNRNNQQHRSIQNRSTSSNPQSNYNTLHSVVHREGGLTVYDADNWEDNDLHFEENFPSMPAAAPKPQSLGLNFTTVSNGAKPGDAAWPVRKNDLSAAAFPKLSNPNERKDFEAFQSFNQSKESSSRQSNISMTQRKPLVLSAKSISATSQISEQRPNSIFGNAKPREVTLAEKGINYIERDTQYAKTQSKSYTCDGLFCPYPPKLLLECQALGGISFISMLENQLKDYVLDKAGLHYSFDVMSARKRLFVHTICTNFWLLDTHSVDPEPNRHIRLAKTPQSIIPQVTLCKALINFPHLVNSDNVNYQSQPFSVSSLALWDVRLVSGEVRASTNDIHGALNNICRPSEYNIHFVDDYNIIIEFSSVIKAFKTFNMFLNAGSRIGNIKFNRVQRWIAGINYAAYQLDLIRADQKLEKEKEKQLRIEARLGKKQQQQLAQSHKTAWDDSDDENDQVSAKKTKKKKSPKKKSNNLFDMLDSSSESESES